MSLTRSSNSMVGGVCAGIAEHFDIDPIIPRLIFALLAIAGVGFPILIYILLWILIPD